MSSQCLSVDDGDRLLDLSKRVASVLVVEARCARATYDSSRYAGSFGGSNLRTKTFCENLFPPALT